MKKLVIILAIILLVVVGFKLILRQGGENAWVCENGQWVKHGNPSEPAPDELCQSEEQKERTVKKEAVLDYIEENIGILSPVEPVLGGSWYTTMIEFVGEDEVDVIYEDGHIESRFTARYGVDENGDVKLSEIEVVDEETEKLRNKETKGDANDDSDEVCEDMCGDGVCQEIVCMAVGCPCAETAESCAEDCE